MGAQHAIIFKPPLILNCARSIHNCKLPGVDQAYGRMKLNDNSLMAQADFRHGWQNSFTETSCVAATARAPNECVVTDA